MSMKKLLLALSFIAFISCKRESPQTGNDGTPLPAKDQIDISYGSQPQQKFDLYLPAGRSAKTTKVYIYLHGGGWTRGDKSEITPGMDRLKATVFPKYAIANMNYVLAIPGTRNALPDQINDIQAVMDMIKSNAAEYQVKPEFVLCGWSAGAHLSMFYGFSKNNPDVKAVINIEGPSDMNDPAYDTLPLMSVIEQLINPLAIPPGMTARTYASPVTWITHSSPPTLSFYGTLGDAVPTSQKIRLENKLTSAGIRHETYTYVGGHADWRSDPILAWLLEKEKNFLNTYDP